MNYQTQISDSLILQNQSHIYIPNFLFETSRCQLIKRNQLKIIFSSIKSCLGILLIIFQFILSQDDNNLNDEQFLFSIKDLKIWLFITVIHSIFALFQYIFIQKLFKTYQVTIQLAQQMDQVNIIQIQHTFDQLELQFYIQEQNELQDQQLIHRLLLFDQSNTAIAKNSEELYEKLQDIYKYLKFLNKFMVIIFFFIEQFALLFLFYSYEIQFIDTLYYYLSMSYMIIVALIGLVQYFSTFALAFLYIIFLPVILSYKIYLWYKGWKDRRIQKTKILDTFQEIIFDKHKHLDENSECAICMCNLEENQKVIILTCSDKHIFHTDCIVDWLKLNTNCPLCRKQVIDQQ